MAYRSDRFKGKMEEYYNKTSTQIREMLRENIRNGLIVQQMQRELVGDIKLTPAEVRNYFKNLPSDSIPSIPTQVEVQIIVREPKIKEEEIERVKKNFVISLNRYTRENLHSLYWLCIIPKTRVLHAVEVNTDLQEEVS